MDKIAQSAAIYLRVSSEEQTKGYSLDNQQDRLVGYCKSHSIRLNEKHIFREEGVSGAKLKRPELDRLMVSAKAKEFDIVLVYKLDRFSRNLKNLLELVTELGDYGIGFQSTTENFETATPMGKYMLQNMGAIAELEREMIRERTISGQIRYRKEGNWCSSIPPYGYNYNKETHKLEINEGEAEVVVTMYNWLVNDGISLHKIQTRLNDLKIPTKYDNLGKSKTVNGKMWWKKRTIGRILSNEVYSGQFTYRKYKYLGRVKGESNLRPKEDWIMITTPQIVPRHIFGQAQVQLQKNKDYSPRNTKRTYLFAKMIICGVCGGRFGSSFEKVKTSDGFKERIRYGCYNRAGWTRKDRCQSSSVTESRIADPIWSKIVWALSNPKLICDNLEKINKSKVDDAPAKIKQLESLIRSCKEKQKRLLELYLEGNLNKQVYEKKEPALTKELESLVIRKKEYEDNFISKEERELRAKSINSLFKKYLKNLNSLTYKQKRSVLEMIIDKIVIKNNDIDIHINIPYVPIEGQSTHFQNHCRLD
ncbi:recombinase family protein [Patescibacteria group bacterium]|nr:recombinase family protein [Patescibacteria group bacterium]